MLAWLSENWPLVLSALFALDRLADVIARLTPSKADDVWAARFHDALQKLASLGLKPAK